MRIDIRASSLSNYNDCPRRSAGNNRSLAPLFKQHGYEIKKYSGNNAGNLIGSACHEAGNALAQSKIEGRDLSDDYRKLYDIADKKFSLDIKKDGFPDDRESPDESTARKQIKRMLYEFLPWASTLDPARIEFNLECRLDPVKEYFLTGHPDHEEKNHDIIDYKFGKNLSQYHAQLGSYRLMSRASNRPMGKLAVAWVKRCSLDQPQAKLEVIDYNVKTAETQAWYGAYEIMRQIEKFKETGIIEHFPVNPSSMLCSKKWCSLHSTPMCDMGKPEKTPRR